MAALLVALLVVLTTRKRALVVLVRAFPEGVGLSVTVTRTGSGVPRSTALRSFGFNLSVSLAVSGLLTFVPALAT